MSNAIKILELERFLPVMSACDRVVYASALLDPLAWDFTPEQESRWDALLAVQIDAIRFRLESLKLKSVRPCKIRKVKKS